MFKAPERRHFSETNMIQSVPHPQCVSDSYSGSEAACLQADYKERQAMYKDLL